MHLHITNYYYYVITSWDPELRLTPVEALNHEWILEVCICVCVCMCRGVSCVVSLYVCVYMCVCTCVHALYVCVSLHHISLCHNL